MTTQPAEQGFNTADMKNLHYHAFNYRNAHSVEASKAFDILEDFVNRYGIAASDRWRDEWSEVCNENQILHNTCDEQQKYLSEQAAEIDRLKALLDEIRVWSEAYPLSVFPEPDFKKAHKVLADNGMTLDAISASNMRHVITRVQRIVDDSK